MRFAFLILKTIKTSNDGKTDEKKPACGFRVQNPKIPNTA
jgi:hypothetical protein